jgi:hypothetical protein
MALLALAILGALSPVQLEAQDYAADARRAVRYVERGERPGLSARSVASRADVVGIDVNSSVEIVVETDSLHALLGRLLPASETVDLASILERTHRLRAFVDSLGVVQERLRDLYEVDDDSFVSKRAAAAGAAGRALDVLGGAIAARPGASVDDVLERTTMGPGQVWGFQWDTVRVIFEEEISALGTDLDGRLGAAGVTARIQANLIKESGPEPIALPGYNRVQVGPAVRYSKIAFAVSDEEKRAFSAYDSLATRIRESNDAVGEVTSLLKRQFAEDYPEIQVLFTAASDLIDAVGSVADTVGAAGGRFESAVQGLGDDLTEEVASLASALDQFGKELLEDIAPARVFSELRSPTADLTAVSAMNSILGVLQGFDDDALGVFLPEQWETKQGEFTNMLVSASDTAVAILRRSTGDLLSGVSASLDSAVVILGRVDASAVAAIESLRLSQAFEGPFPPPPGLQARDFSGGLGSRLDLQTIAGGRTPGQRVVVTYELLRDDDVLLEWTDNLVIQSYGFTGTTAASLAFVQREGASKFEPLPIITWSVRYRGWPGDDERGVGTSLLNHIGFGVSTMTLDFVDEESVEVGLAGTLSLGDLVFVGGGLNLQATDDRTFWFFSLRLLKIPGVFGTMR